jgi:hypothetical protein
MKNRILLILLASLMLVGVTTPIRAQMATREEVLNVARNWITLIIDNKGSWGEYDYAQVVDVRNFKRGDRVLAHFCEVEPMGFIIVSLRKELAPVKAYSSTSGVDPGFDIGICDVIKLGLENVLNTIEMQLGPIETVRSEDMDDLVAIRHEDAWDRLSNDVYIPPTEFEYRQLRWSYEQGDTLLGAMNWIQRPPYNDWCPDQGCDWSQYNNFNSNARVGCVATAGSMIMNYWKWPPYGEGTPYDDAYEWAEIESQYNWDFYLQYFTNEHGDSVTPDAINAVAELCHEVGLAAGMNYGCDESWALLSDNPLGGDMLDAYEDHYRYNLNVDIELRLGYDPIEWFDLIVFDVSKNRPLQYGMATTFGLFAGHSMVVDGWQVISGPLHQFHVNYGWVPGVDCDGHECNYWYNVDEVLPFSDGWSTEEMLKNIYPNCAEGPVIEDGLNPLDPNFPYCYFDHDTKGNDAYYEIGRNFQFLPNVTVQCTSFTGGSVDFQSSVSDTSRFFTRGDVSEGVLMYGGGISLYKNGTVILY